MEEFRLPYRSQGAKSGDYIFSPQQREEDEQNFKEAEFQVRREKSEAVVVDLDTWRKQQAAAYPWGFGYVLELVFFPLVFPSDDYIDITRKAVLCIGFAAGSFMIFLGILFTYWLFEDDQQGEVFDFFTIACMFFGIPLTYFGYFGVRLFNGSVAFWYSVLLIGGAANSFLIGISAPSFAGSAILVAIFCFSIMTRMPGNVYWVSFGFIFLLFLMYRECSQGLHYSHDDDTGLSARKSNHIEHMIYHFFGVSMLALIAAAYDLQYREFVEHLNRAEYLRSVLSNISGGAETWDLDRIRSALVTYHALPTADSNLYEEFLLIACHVGNYWSVLPQNLVMRLGRNNKTLLESFGGLRQEQIANTADRVSDLLLTFVDNSNSYSSSTVSASESSTFGSSHSHSHSHSVLSLNESVAAAATAVVSEITSNAAAAAASSSSPAVTTTTSIVHREGRGEENSNSQLYNTPRFIEEESSLGRKDSTRSTRSESEDVIDRKNIISAFASVSGSGSGSGSNDEDGSFDNEKKKDDELLDPNRPLLLSSMKLAFSPQFYFGSTMIQGVELPLLHEHHHAGSSLNSTPVNSSNVSASFGSGSSGSFSGAQPRFSASSSMSPLHDYDIPTTFSRSTTPVDVFDGGINKSVSSKMQQQQQHQHRNPLTVLVVHASHVQEVSELIQPSLLASILERYFNLITAIIESHGGMTVTISPSRIVAVWSSEVFWKEDTNKHASNRNSNHEENRATLACFAAMHIVHRVRDAVIPLFRAENCVYPFRVVVHHGYASVGPLGCEDQTRYTIAGPAIDFANQFMKLAWIGFNRSVVLASEDVVALARRCKSHPGIGLVTRDMAEVTRQPLPRPAPEYDLRHKICIHQLIGVQILDVEGSANINLIDELGYDPCQPATDTLSPTARPENLKVHVEAQSAKLLMQQFSVGSTSIQILKRMSEARLLRTAGNFHAAGEAYDDLIKSHLSATSWPRGLAIQGVDLGTLESLSDRCRENASRLENGVRLEEIERAIYLYV